MMEQALTEYLINALWQLPLLAAGGWCLVRIAKPGPRVQYCFWVALLFVAVLLPACGIPQADARPPQAAVAMSHTYVASRSPAALSFVSPPPAARQRQPWLSLTTLFATHTVRMSKVWMQWLVRLYLGTVIFALLRVVQAWRNTGLLVAQARPCSAHDAALRSFSRRFAVAPPQTRESAQIDSPVMVGVMSPVLLLPEEFAKFSAEEIRAALCHELAHLKRHDYLVNLTCQLASTPLVWHPVLGFIQQRIRTAREMACDEWAARETGSQVVYARCLLTLAQSMLGLREVEAQRVVIGLFGGQNVLEERIMQLTGHITEPTELSLRTRAFRVVAGAAMVSASFALAATIHLSPKTTSASRAMVQIAEPPVKAAPTPQPGKQSKPSPVGDGAFVVYHDGRVERHALTQKQQAEIRQQVEAARKQAAEATAMIHSEAFRKQMEDARQQASRAQAMVKGEQFQRQIQDAGQQAVRTREFFNSDAFRRQMDDAKKQAAEAEATFSSPQFKQQLEDATRAAAAASEQIRSQEFQQQMEEVKVKIGEAMKDFQWKFDSHHDLKIDPPTDAPLEQTAP